MWEAAAQQTIVLEVG